MPASLYSGLILTAALAWQQVLQVGPYVAAGMLLAAVLGQVEWPLQRWRWLRRGDLPTVLGAAFLGVASPISSHVAVPVLLQFLGEGASAGPLLAFLVASTMLNPQLFLIILGGLGVRLALAHLLGVLTLSGLAGMVAARLSPALLLHPTALAAAPALLTRRSPSGRRLLAELLNLAGWVGLTFVLGAVVAAALQIWVPPQWAGVLLTQNRPLSAAAAALLGLPFYHCGAMAVPVLASLMEAGLSRAAVLAFLLVGPAMRARSLAAVGSLLNRRALAVYALGVMTVAVVVSLALG